QISPTHFPFALAERSSCTGSPLQFVQSRLGGEEPVKAQPGARQKLSHVGPAPRCQIPLLARLEVSRTGAIDPELSLTHLNSRHRDGGKQTVPALSCLRGVPQRHPRSARIRSGRRGWGTSRRIFRRFGRRFRTSRVSTTR